MQILTMVPFLLALRINVEPFNRTLEYTYNIRKNITVFRDPIQTTLYTAAVTCQTEIRDSLLCLLHDIDIRSTLTYQNLNTTNLITHEQYYTNDDWFTIKFNNRGLEKLLVNSTSDKKDLIKEIAFQFHIGGDIVSMFTVKEKSVVGNCITTFNVNSTINKTKDEEILEHQIILSSMSSYYEKIFYEEYKSHERHVHIYIEKNRRDCQYSSAFFDFLNGMEVTKYIHTIEIFDDKLNISTTMEVQLPADPWNPSGTPVFKETMQLSLTNITSPRTKVFDPLVRDKYIWTDLME